MKNARNQLQKRLFYGVAVWAAAGTCWGFFGALTYNKPLLPCLRYGLEESAGVIGILVGIWLLGLAILKLGDEFTPARFRRGRCHYPLAAVIGLGMMLAGLVTCALLLNRLPKWIAEGVLHQVGGKAVSSELLLSITGCIVLFGLSISFDSWRTRRKEAQRDLGRSPSCQ